MNNKNLFTKMEIAFMFGVGIRTVNTWLTKGIIKGRKIKNVWYVERKDLYDYLDSQGLTLANGKAVNKKDVAETTPKTIVEQLELSKEAPAPDFQEQIDKTISALDDFDNKLNEIIAEAKNSLIDSIADWILSMDESSQQRIKEALE